LLAILLKKMRYDDIKTVKLIVLDILSVNIA